jgi:hypothetical protein
MLCLISGMQNGLAKFNLPALYLYKLRLLKQSEELYCALLQQSNIYSFISHKSTKIARIPRNRPSFHI